MLVPSWVNNQIQPIAVRDVLAYLRASLERGPSGIVEIGGCDQLTYRQMIEIYARVRGLRRYIVSMVPFVPPAHGGQDLRPDHPRSRARWPNRSSRAWSNRCSSRVAEPGSSSPK